MGRGCRSLLATHAKASRRIELVIPGLKATSFARWGTWVPWRRSRNHAAPLWKSSTHRVLRHKQVRGQVAPWTLVAALLGAALAQASGCASLQMVYGSCHPGRA